MNLLNNSINPVRGFPLARSLSDNPTRLLFPEEQSLVTLYRAERKISFKRRRNLELFFSGFSQDHKDYSRAMGNRTFRTCGIRLFLAFFD